MHIQQIAIGCMGLAGGTLVIASYLLGLARHPTTRDQAWGNVPKWLKPYYYTSMLLAAAGFFAFSYFVLFSLERETVRIGRFDFSLFIALYALILFPSALWMPLTFAQLERPRKSLWWAIRVTLAVVGLASLGLLAAVAAVNTKEPAYVYGLAVAGGVFFSIQTALLDALVWPVYFPAKG
jgi:hypothetical protein